VLGAACAILVSRNTYNFYDLLRDLLGGGFFKAAAVYAASLACSGGILLLICLWAKPLIERAVGDAPASKKE